MLNILLGRAGIGKTNHIMYEINRRMAAGETGMLLIVPEQYSHDAERQLCLVCGDSLSLHAEVFSFTRLCNQVFSETGGAAGRIIDSGGQILLLHKALDATAHSLKVFGVKKMRTEILESLLKAVKEFQSMCILPQRLEEMGSNFRGSLSDKLSDLAVITDAYNAMQRELSANSEYSGDATELLALLAEKIGESSVGKAGHIYFDGFSDFTAQEMRVIDELLRKGADITVCLTCDNEKSAEDGMGEIFEIPRRTIAELRRMCDKIDSVPVSVTYLNADSLADNTRRPELRHLEKHLFDDAPPMYIPPMHVPSMSEPMDEDGRGSQRSISSLGSIAGGDLDAVTLYAAPSRYSECEHAARAVWEMVRSGYRWRDIGVMARDFSEYETICEFVFEKYGIPYFIGGKADILSKPPIALIDAALDIAIMGWEYKSVFRYLKTGLLTISTDDCSLLENYVIVWKIRGSQWLRDWTMPAYGYAMGFGRSKDSDDSDDELERINALRRKIVEPLVKLRNGITGDSSVEKKLTALYTFLTDIELPHRLTEKADNFAQRGELRLADEYTQLLNIVFGAMDQMFELLGSNSITAAEFRKLIMLVLSQHDIGVIPIALDRTPLGGMAMSRRRDLKCLIVLGANDENMPSLASGTGVLSDNERKRLSELDGSFPAGMEERLFREMNLLYSTLTLPTQRLVMTYTRTDTQRPSYIFKRLCDIFGVAEKTLTQEECLIISEKTYLELQNRERMSITFINRERLSSHMAQMLYGKNISMSASRVNNYYSCAYRHFLQSGLRLASRTVAEFDAASAGNFMHYILSNVFGEIKASTGFKNIEDEKLDVMSEKYIGNFIDEVLLNFDGKDSRFEYLFRSYKENVIHVVRDMVDELKYSKFEPIGLEMNLSDFSETERGYIDRVDAYRSNDKLYLRVIDYKTRRQAYPFDLRDVLHGRDMQMLIYLFALKKYGKRKFRAEVESAGVLYVPARDVVINAPRNAGADEIGKLREKEMRRSGLILNDGDIIDAMESGESKKYIPVKMTKDGTLAGSSLVSSRQMEMLSKHVEGMMDAAKNEIKSGANDCSPYYKNAADNACVYCEYSAVCRFDEEMGDKRRIVRKMNADDVWRELES